MCLVLISPLYSVGVCFRCWAWEGRSKRGICSDLEDRGSCLHTSGWPAMAPLSSSSCAPGCMPGFCLFWTPSLSFRGHGLSSHRTESTGSSRPPFSFIPAELELLILLSLPLPFLWQHLRTAEHTCPSASFIKEALSLETAPLFLWLCVYKEKAPPLRW